MAAAPPTTEPLLEEAEDDTGAGVVRSFLSRCRLMDRRPPGEAMTRRYVLPLISLIFLSCGILFFLYEGIPGVSKAPFVSVNYNIFARSYMISHDGQRERAAIIPDALVNGSAVPDVISLCEAFETGAQEVLTHRFNELGYQVVDATLSPDLMKGQLENGGVMVLTRHPVLKTATLKYTECVFADCLAAKGAIYVAVNSTKHGTVHVFATHMQAWPDERAVEARLNQAKELKEFVEAQNIPKDQMVIVQGDLNVDGLHAPEELNAFAQVFEIPAFGGLTPSCDPSRNVLVGRDGAAKEDGCAEEYVNNIENGTKTPCADEWLAGKNCVCSCCRAERLDHMFLLSEGRATVEVERPHVKAFPIPISGILQPVAEPISGNTAVIEDLSDHYPVVGKFSLPGGMW